MCRRRSRSLAAARSLACDCAHYTHEWCGIGPACVHTRNANTSPGEEKWQVTLAAAGVSKQPSPWNTGANEYAAVPCTKMPTPTASAAPLTGWLNSDQRANIQPVQNWSVKKVNAVKSALNTSSSVVTYIEMMQVHAGVVAQHCNLACKKDKNGCSAEDIGSKIHRAARMGGRQWLMGGARPAKTLHATSGVDHLRPRLAIQRCQATTAPWRRTRQVISCCSRDQPPACPAEAHPLRSLSCLLSTVR